MASVAEDNYYDDGYKDFAASGFWLEPRLADTLLAAASSGKLLPTAGVAHYLFKKSWKYAAQNFGPMIKRNWFFDYDFIHYIIRDFYGWGLPSRDDIDKIMKYAPLKERYGVLDIGCGSAFWSSILQWYIPVAPLDDFSEDKTWSKIWLPQDRIKTNILNKEEFEYNMHRFEKTMILLIYPRQDVLQYVFKNAPLGTRFYIKIPPVAGIYSNQVKWLIDSSEVLDDDIKSWTCNERPKPESGSGAILQKVRNIPLGENSIRPGQFFLDEGMTWFELYFGKGTDKKSLKNIDN